MNEWKKCVKKPVQVWFKEPDKPMDITTLEGEIHLNPETDYLMKGIDGELYPIKKDIFHRTYEVIDNENKDENKKGKEAHSDGT